jgi:SAM-dependent methyltransferase
VASVLDVGCAAGTWLRVWQEQTETAVYGLDGEYIALSALEIPRDCFKPADLSKPIDLGRQFDLVQSLEVAEHIAPERSADFVSNVVRHSRGIVAFSAAVPGQGGEYHINEQPLEFWRDLFLLHGYHAFDFIRPRILNDRRVSFWYRFNILIYIHQSLIPALSKAVRSTRIPDNVSIPDVSPPMFRARKAVVRLLPYRLQHELARLKARTK